MSLLATFLILTGLSLVLVPALLRYLLVTFGLLTHLDFTMIHPFSVGNISLRHNLSLSFVRSLIVLVDRATFRIKGWKLQLNIQSLQVFLQLNDLNFQHINQLKANFEAKTLNNICNILPELLEYFLTRVNDHRCVPKAKAATDVKERGPFTKSLTGIITVGVMLVTQFVEINISNLEVDFTEDTSQNIDYLRLKALSILNIRATLILTRFRLTKEYQLQLKVTVPSFLVEEFSDVGREIQRTILEIEDTSFVFTLPFNLSFHNALSHSDSGFRMELVRLNILPRDLEHICDLIAGIVFMSRVKEFCNSKASKRKDQNNPEEVLQKAPTPTSFSSFVIEIHKIELNIHEIYQKDSDTPQASQYLTSIQKSTILANRLVVNVGEGGDVRLQIADIKLELEMMEYTLQVLEIIAFTFESQNVSPFNSLKTIKHNNVVVETAPEALAALTKIFMLIARTRRQHYEIINYLQFLDYYLDQQRLLFSFVPDGYLHFYLTGLKEKMGEQLTPPKLLKIYKQSLNRPILLSNKVEMPEQDIQDKVSYSVGQVTFNLTLKDMTHRLDFMGASYQRITERSRVLNIVKIDKLNVMLPASSKKEFELSKVLLYIKEGKLLIEVDMYIEEFIATQDQLCLIQYLVGFPTIQRAMQIKSNQKPSGNSSRSRQIYSIKKTTISYQKIFLSFQDFSFQVGTKLLDSTELNMSVSKIGLMYKFDSKISNPEFQFINKKTIKKDVDLLKVVGVSLKSYQNRHLIQINHPQIMLPKEFLGMGHEYQRLGKTIDNLSTYLQAYLLNISDQVLREIQKNIQQKIQRTTSVEIRCYKLSVSIEESQWNTFVLNYQRVVREYLSQQQFYNQQEIINEINRKKSTKPLLELTLGELRVEMGPVRGLDTVDAIVTWMKDIGEVSFLPSEVLFFHHGIINTSLHKLIISVRDYPFNILEVEALSLEVQQLSSHMKQSYQIDNCVYSYYIANAQIGEMTLYGGLNISSALKQLVLRYNRLVEGYQREANTTAQEMIWLDQIKKLKAKTQTKVQVNTTFVPYWEIFRQRTFFKLTLQKNKDTILNLLTDVRPYSTEAIVTKVGKLYILSDKEEILITFMGMSCFKELNYEMFQIVDFGKFSCKTILAWKPLLNLEFQFAMADDYNNFVHLRTDVVEYLINLPQLRTDILLLYGIDIPKPSTQFGDLSGKTIQLSLIKWMNYGQLVQFAFDKTLQKNKNTLSIWNVIESVSFVMSLREISVLMSIESQSLEQDEPQGVQVLLGHVRLRLLCYPSFKATKAEWIVKDGSGKIDTTIGRIYRGSLLTLNEIESRYLNSSSSFRNSRDPSFSKDLFETLVIAESRMKDVFQEYPKQKDQRSQKSSDKRKEEFFLQSNSLIFIKNHLHRSEDGRHFLARNYIEYDGLKLMLSGNLINVLAKISAIKINRQIIVVKRDNDFKKKKKKASEGSGTRISYFKEMEEQITRKQNLLERFRNAVRKIINHRRKGSMVHLFKEIKLNVMFVLTKPQFNVFYEEKHSQIIVSTPKSCQIHVRINHLPYDTLELDTKYTLKFIFQEFEMWSSSQCRTVQWLNQDPKAKDQMQLCLQCPETVLDLSLFKLEKCSIDFGLMTFPEENEDIKIDRTRMWGVQPRRKELGINLKEVVIELDGTQKLVLINIIQFFILLSSSKKKRFIQNTKTYQSKINEIKIYGRNKMLQKLILKANKDIQDTQARVEMTMSLNLSKISLRLVNRSQESQHVSSCFLVINSQEISLNLQEQSNNCLVVAMEAKEIQIINPLEESRSKFRVTLAMNHLGKTALKLHLETYMETLFDKSNTWPYHRLFSLSLNPIKVRFTDQLYRSLYEYILFGLNDMKYIPESLVQKSSLDRFAQPQEIQQYYNKIVIEPIKLQLWYDSSNVLKRMDGISIQLGRFIKGGKFCFKRDIFDNWAKFVLKQIVKQTFSVLGQKMFGGDEEPDSDDEQMNVN